MTQPTQQAPNQIQRLTQFLRSPLFPIFMIVFVDVLGLGITIPVLPLFAQNLFSATPLQITLLQSAYFLAQFVASPQLGRMSDKVGRRPVLLLSQIGTFAAFLISGSAIGLPILYLARIVDGLTGGNISVAQAYLSDVTDEKNRAQGIGIVNAAFGSGFLFGPAFGAFMASQFGPRVPFFIAAVISLVTISLTFFKLPESLTAERRARMKPRDGAAKKSPIGVFRVPGVALLMVIAFSGQLAFFSFQSVWVLWAEKILFAGFDPKVGQQAIGGILSLVGFTGVLTQVFLVKPIVRRYGERAMVAGGLFVRSIPWVLMTFLPYVALIAVAAPLISFGNGLIVPGLMAMLTYLVPPGERGYAIGLAESVQGLGRISAPLVAGLLFENVSPGAPLGFAALIGFLSAGIALALWRMPVGRPAAKQEGGPA